MKTLLPIIALAALAPTLGASGKDVWYNAKGKAVKTTPAGKEKPSFVPLWKKRELAREADRAARRDNRVRHSPASRYYYACPGYGFHGYGHYYGHGCHAGLRFPRYSCRHRPHWRFSGTYHGSGWSVRLRY